MDAVITAADSKYERDIRTTLRVLPKWLVRAARLSKVEVSSDAVVIEQTAMYQHGSRVLRVAPRLGVPQLRQAIAHELGHGVDDTLGIQGFDHPHYFSSTEVWFRLHRGQAYFEFPKYAEYPLEYFADCVAKFALLGKDKFSITHPREAIYIASWVVPTVNRFFRG